MTETVRSNGHIHELVIHAGLPKTGTTLLQKTLFEMRPKLREAGLAYIGRSDMLALPDYLAWSAYLNGPTSRQKERFAVQLRRLVARESAAVADSWGLQPRTVLISDEAACGQNVRGVVVERPFRPRAARAVRELVELLQPGITRVIVYVRRQDKMLESMYMHEIHGGESFTFEHFLEANREPVIFYTELIQRLEAVSGVDSVEVYPFEFIDLGAVDFVASFLRFVGYGEQEVHETVNVTNPGYSLRALDAALEVNPVLHRLQLKKNERVAVRHLLETLFPITEYPKAEFLSQEQRREILDAYRGDNRALFERYIPSVSPDAYSSVEASTRAIEGVDPRIVEPVPGQNVLHERKVRWCEQLMIHGSAGDEVERALAYERQSRPRAAQGVYLHGQSLLLQRRYKQAREGIDRAFELKAWVRELPPETPGLREAAHEAREVLPGWPWAEYEVERTRFSAPNLTLDDVAARHLNHADTYVVQIGANDGRSGDPIHSLCVRFRWRGLLVEPHPVVFETLERNYLQQRDRLELVNVAIADGPGKVELFVDPNDRSTLSSMVPERNALGRDQSRELESILVDAVTIPGLLAEHEVETVDVLQIDTEGYDYEILKQFEFDRFHPRVVHMEFYCLPIADRLAAFELLRSHGYVWVAPERDLLAMDAGIARSMGVREASRDWLNR